MDILKIYRNKKALQILEGFKKKFFEN